MKGILRQRLEMARALAAVAFLFACAAFGSGPADAATNVAASFSQEGGHGRIVLTWPGGVPAHKEELTSGVLVIAFDKPFATDLDEFRRQMPNYVALARQDGDGKALRLALKFDYWMNVQQAENSLYVDLLPRSWAGTPPPLPAEVLARIAAAKAARQKAEEEARLVKERGIVEPNAPKPDLSVRVGRHDGITRLVFDWNQPVLYSVVQQEGAATITFDRTAKVSLAPIRVNPPPYLESVTAQEREGRLSVFLKLAPGVTVTDFREELGIVLDLKPSQPLQLGGEMAASPAPQAEAAPAKAAEPAPEAASPDKHAQAGHVPQTILPASVATPAEPAPPPSAAHAETPPPVAHPEAEAHAEAPAPAPGTPALKAEAHDAEASKTGTEPPATPHPAAEAATAPEAVPEKAPASAQAHVPDSIAVVSRDLEDRTELSFPWPVPTGAAVFVRANMLWIVFDQRTTLDLSQVETDPAKRIGKPVAVAVEGGVGLAFPILGQDLLVGATEEGTGWRVSIGERLASTGQPITISRAWRDTGEGVISFDLKGVRNVLRVQDPMVRDTLDVATARAPIQSIQTPRSFIEFQVLQTAQGLAIVRVADDLNVAAATDTVIVTRRSGLTLSADSGGPGLQDPETGTPTGMDFAAWRGHGNFIDGRQAHERAITFSDVQGLAAARLDYARFLVGYGLGPEALTQIGLAVAADSKISGDYAFRELRGVANIMAGRYPAAIADLSVNALAMDPYAAAWRGLARAELDQPDAARKDFDLAAPLVDTMDSGLAARVNVTAARVDLEMNDVAAARAHLAHLPDDIGDPHLKAEALFLHAQIIEKLHRPMEAAAAYDRAIATNTEPYAVSARFQKALLLNRTGKLGDKQLADELDKLRMMWRGTDIERRILSKLAELRLAQGDIVSALKVMHDTTMNFPDSDEARALGARMPDIFADFFIGGQADKLPAVQALAVYRDFQDLTPLGKKGDELIRHLAEQLVSVDLLPQAEKLLSYQIDQRLVGGFAKAQVAARLAAVYLLDDKAQDALRTIRSTMQNLLPADLDRQRRLLEARALASLKRYDLSLDLLSEMLGPDADALRADVLWEGQRWEEAGRAAETLLADTAEDKPLTPDDRFQIMRGAISYSLADDEEGLGRLRAKFGKRMTATDDASAFAIVSDPIEKQGVAFRELASRIASVNTMERFINSLKKTDKVSAIDGIPVASN